jgi:two-component system, OmpR family, sensor histidine kinase KdpD
VRAPSVLARPIIGAASTLRDFPANLAKADRAELLGTVLAEAERLNRFIANLLDMTRLESGAIAPNRAAHDLAEIIGSALERAARVLLDPVLFEQVLFNLLDNAAKYAPRGSTVRIEARPTATGAAAVRVLDEGDGIPADELEHVFDKFHRVRKGDRVRAGTGLGLAVCRGFVEAMGARSARRSSQTRSGRPTSGPKPAWGIDSSFLRRVSALPPLRRRRLRTLGPAPIRKRLKTETHSRDHSSPRERRSSPR